ncbi:MAG: 30S ribosomal protein S2 [Planctomycetes bacterium]|jgi:small subunit ribosomal protein S2|nr:30S ribosomal protein S2 [Planctomycetota bacterium]
MAAIPSIRDLMASGVHFGHRSSRWNPKMKPFIFMKRNLVHIIDLKATLRNLLVASRFLTHAASKGGEILFIGTKRQARNVTLNQARRSGMHYVTERWLGGTLTNFPVIRTRMKRLDSLEELERSGHMRLYSKKMQTTILRVKSKMLRNLEGIRKMVRLPDAIVIVDPGREKNAVAEARRLRIPVIAILDTDCDPELVDIPIPANDDAMRSIAVILEKLGDAVIEGVEYYKAHVGPLPEAKPAPEAKIVHRRPPGRDGDRGDRRGFRGGRRTDAIPQAAPPRPATEARPHAPEARGAAPEAAPPPAPAAPAPTAPPPAAPGGDAKPA